ncbi:MAG: lignostilbene alpha-beta-dioxygenase, partial [Cytophagaceae bacterium]
GQPYRYAWSIGRPPGHPLPLLDHLLKLDVQTGAVRTAYQPDTLCSEPVIIPRQAGGAEDDAYLAYLRYDAPTNTTDLLVADAATLTTLARLRLPHNIPLGFHGLWLAD